MEFAPFPKIARLERYAQKALLTEKLDGTNAQIAITEDGDIFVGSRNRWLAPGKSSDNFGFAGYVLGNREEFLKLGPGRHFGEWYGHGIGPNGYGLSERRLALFDVLAWRERREALPAGVELVTVLAEGWFDPRATADAYLARLAEGSIHVPGWPHAEGLVVNLLGTGERYKHLLKPGPKAHPSPIEEP